MSSMSTYTVRYNSAVLQYADVFVVLLVIIVPVLREHAY